MAFLMVCISTTYAQVRGNANVYNQPAAANATYGNLNVNNGTPQVQVANAACFNDYITIIQTKLLLNKKADSYTAIFHLTQVILNPAAPLAKAVEIETPLSELESKTLIFVDDVANTGRTIFYAMKPVLLDVVPKKVEVAVLVDRKHKSFPISINYVGLSLATTLSENIEVQIREVETMAVYLN